MKLNLGFLRPRNVAAEELYAQLAAELGQPPTLAAIAAHYAATPAPAPPAKEETEEECPRCRCEFSPTALCPDCACCEDCCERDEDEEECPECECAYSPDEFCPECGCCPDCCECDYEDEDEAEYQCTACGAEINQPFYSDSNSTRGHLHSIKLSKQAINNLACPVAQAFWWGRAT